MPEFARIAKRLIMRAEARQRLVLGGADEAAPAGDWRAAQAALKDVIRRHGADGREGALAQLAEIDPLLVELVDRVRWARLCKESWDENQWRYRDVFNELRRDQTKEQAA